MRALSELRSPSFFHARAHNVFRLLHALGVAGDLRIHLAVEGLDALAARDLVEEDVRLGRLDGLLTLGVAVLLPVHADLGGVQPLQGRAAGGVFGARHHVALDEGVRHLEPRALNEGLEHRVLGVAVDLVLVRRLSWPRILSRKLGKGAELAQSLRTRRPPRARPWSSRP